MEFIQTVLAFVVTLGILVTIHEWGHYIVARLCGVKVLRFSVGFGKVLYSRVDKHGTEFALAAIPLGGYVKMLDEREGDVPDALKKQAFNTKSVWQRIAIVAAGPVINLLFAVLAYWVLFVSGVNTVAPVIGSLVEGSIAEQVSLPVGAEIIAIDGRKIGSWQDVNLALAGRIGDSGTLRFEVQGGAKQGTYSLSQYDLQLDNWSVDLETQGPIDALGIVRYRPAANLIVAHLLEGGRAKLAGLQFNDQILAISGRE
ncbi:MAG: RIP metalloprotease RseP, partial [Pseudomonadales bacterium]|nr:RIP metalloprotease RseP [Pseudomonadales bacterium]